MKIIQKYSFFTLFNKIIKKAALLCLLAIVVWGDSVKGGRWGGTDTEHMNQLHQMETNHSNFVQNYYRSENRNNKRLNTEMEAIKELNYMKNHEPEKYKQVVANLQKNGFIRGGQLVGNWYLPQQSKKIKNLI